ncbi:hypothetical protein GIB67_025201, partial [Kingdonia uniflora]
EGDAATTEEAKKSNHVARKAEKRQEGRQLDAHIEEQFGGSRLLACIAFHPGTTMQDMGSGDSGDGRGGDGDSGDGIPNFTEVYSFIGSVFDPISIARLV